MDPLSSSSMGSSRVDRVAAMPPPPATTLLSITNDPWLYPGNGGATSS